MVPAKRRNVARRSRSRRALWLLMLLALIIIALLAAQLFLPHERIRRRIEQQLEAQWGVRTQIDGFRCTVFGTFRADRLLFLTDVEGVRGADGDVVPLLEAGRSQRLIRDGVATAGMQAKLNAAQQALREGIRQVVIAPGGQPDVVARLLAGERIGSRLVP